MKIQRVSKIIAAVFALVSGIFLLSPTADMAGAKSPAPRPAKLMLQGGARGLVRGTSGEPVEGIGVQLISTKTAIRTTVYSNEEGRFEFPVLTPGQYTLRVALPREYQPFVKDGLQISGATQLENIVLERVSKTELLPPTPEILSQLTGAEWLMNIPGTAEQKRVLTLSCGFGCHSYQQIFRNRYDERSWTLMLQRMMRGGGSPLIVMAHPTEATPNRFDLEQPLMGDEDMLAKWLSTVRGPDSKDGPMYYLPRPHGEATRVVITEYELPRELLAPHDVSGDSRGNIWYSTHRSPFQGELDPKTGAIKEVRVPNLDDDNKDILPGSHRVWVDKNDIAWFAEHWANHVTGVDTRTGKIVYRWQGPGNQVPNAGGIGNFAMDDAGFLYAPRGGSPATVDKIDAKTGEVVQKWPFKTIGSTYDSIITPDGRYWAGAPIGGKVIALLDTKTGEMIEAQTGTQVSSGSRGGFDPQGNAWFGGRGGMLLKLDAKTHRVTQYFPPIQYDTFYEAMPDKNGDVWAGGLESGHFMRFNQKTEQWTSYMLPEPYAHDRRTWIDNSTDPVSVWYVDHEGYMVRIQPMD